MPSACQPEEAKRMGPKAATTIRVPLQRNFSGTGHVTCSAPDSDGYGLDKQTFWWFLAPGKAC